LIEENVMNKKLGIAIALLATSLGANASTIEMKVYGLVCAFCAQGIEKTLRKNPATQDVLVSLEYKLVAISTTDGMDIADGELVKALTDAGYDVKAITRTQRSIAEIRQALKPR
jgi:copper chaperone CopZ